LVVVHRVGWPATQSGAKTEGGARPCRWAEWRPAT
jgi:hypothetical protein